MFIPNHVMRSLLDCAKKQGVADYDLYGAECLLERAEESERRREERKQQERYVLYEAIYKELESGRSCTPTDLQFLLYNRTGKPWSCQRITRLLCEMAYNLRGKETERWKGVEHDSNANYGPDNRGKSYFHITK